MSFWRPANFAAALNALGGAWLAAPRPIPFRGVSLDSRTIRPGEVFLALKGERADGHDFIAAAARAGAPLGIVERELPLKTLPKGMGVLAVRDGRAALAALARAYRDDALDRVRIVAVTGSNGKTTTGRMIHAVLGTTLRGSAPTKSFNNSIGVPLTLLAAEPDHDYLVCELGSNHPGEIESLSALVRPHVGVITSIGRAHAGAFGSLEAIAREKLSIFAHLQPWRGDGVRILPGDTPLLAHVRPATTFGVGDECTFRVENIAEDGPCIAFRITGGPDLLMGLIGRHNALNAAAAAAVGRAFAVPWEAIARGLGSVRPAEMRLQVRVVRGIDFLEDCYNANPDSMLAAIRTLRAMPARGRRIAILGDMLELGDASGALHAEIAEDLLREPPDAIVLLGPAFAAAGEALASALPDRTTIIADPALAERAAAGLGRGDLVLVKGSRSMRMERVIRAAEAQPAAGTG